MKNQGEKTYEHNGKAVKIIPMKRVKKAESVREDKEVKEKSAPKAATVKRARKTEEEKAQSKFAVGDKVSLKNIPAEYSGYGFAESTIIKVFKSTHDSAYRYTIKSASGQELALLKVEQIKARKS